MCDYDGSYTHLRDKVVVTKKRHECASCMQHFPVGTRMQNNIGLYEGDFQTVYVCPACVWASKQDEHTALHLCWGWNWDGADDYDEHGSAKPRWQYIHDTLAAGGTPTVEGFKALPVEEPAE